MQLRAKLYSCVLSDAAELCSYAAACGPAVCTGLLITMILAQTCHCLACASCALGRQDASRNVPVCAQRRLYCLCTLSLSVLQLRGCRLDCLRAPSLSALHARVQASRNLCSALHDLCTHTRRPPLPCTFRQLQYGCVCLHIGYLQCITGRLPAM